MGQNPGGNYLTVLLTGQYLISILINRIKTVEILSCVCISPFCSPLRLSIKDLHLYYNFNTGKVLCFIPGNS